MLKKTAVPVVLLIMLILQTLVSAQVLQKAQIVRVWDESQYLSRGIFFYRLIFDWPRNPYLPADPYRLWGLLRIETLGQDRPPVLFFAQAFVWRFIQLFNVWDENAVILIVNTVFLSVLIFSCYGIGSLLRSRAAGFVSAVLLSLSPLIYESSRRMMTDLPLTAMLCLSIYCMLKTDMLRSRFYSVCLGLVLAVSQLTRESFFLYMLGPFLCYLYRSFRVDPGAGSRKNLLICMGVASAIIAPVFLRPYNFYIYGKYFAFSGLKNPDSSAFYYCAGAPAVFGYCILVLSAPFFLAALLRIKHSDKVLLLWFIIPAVIFNLSPNKALRFIMPVLPAYFLLLTLHLLKSGLGTGMKRFFLVLMIAAGAVQYGYIHYVPGGERLAPRKYSPDTGPANMRARAAYYPVHKLLLDVFRNEPVIGRRKKRVTAMFSIPEMLYPLQYKFMMYKLPFLPDFPLEADSVDAPKPGAVDWEQWIIKSDYLIDKAGGFQGRQGSREDIRGQLLAALAKHRDRFRILAEIGLSDDGSRVLVYKKISGSGASKK